MSGNSAGFETAYRTHYAAVHRYAAARFGAAEADDIAQEAMLRLWQRYEQLSGDGRSLTPWLIKVAGDIGVDRVRRRRRVVVDSEVVRSAATTVADETARVTLQVDTRPLLGRALRRLPPGERRTLGLHAVGDGIGEIAAVTGLTPNAVRQRLFRARRRLRLHYEQLGGSDYGGYVAWLPTARPATGGRPGWLSAAAERLAAAGLPSLPARPVAATVAFVAALAVTPPVPPPAVGSPDSPRPVESAARPPAARPAGVAGGLSGLGSPTPPAGPAALASVAGRLPAAGTAAGTATGPIVVEAESAGDGGGCADGTTAPVPAIGASGGLAVPLPGSGCGQTFSARTTARLSAIRVAFGGWNYDICGHFEVTGAIVGESEQVCEAPGTWLLVPVRTTAGLGTYTVTWIVDDAAGRTWLDAIVDSHTLTPPAGEPPLAARCDDGADDDHDGAVDSADPGCAGPLDDDEASYAQCDDGIDNDGDGRTDYGDDAACGHWQSATERCLVAPAGADVMRATVECVRQSGELPGVEPPPAVPPAPAAPRAGAAADDS